MGQLSIEKYIGVPFKSKGRSIEEGFDCIGLVIAIEKELGIEIPDVWAYNDAEGMEVASNFLVELTSIDAGASKWKKSKPCFGAVAVFKIAGMVRHIGFFIDNKRFIHVMQGVSTCIESIENPLWHKRLVGVYKWLL